MYIMQMESFTYYMQIGRTNTQSIIFWYWKQKGRLTPIYIYKLPGIIYDSFAVNDNLIYAMNYEKNEIQTIRPLISH